ncbi:hypothetical protein L2E82_28097 [Cichorium intybus]|uniref:Uncharacterized protein n=1 Tax=Cichorium intybus TaxID=13427 RepID=A0ACB9CUU3_CICIN|nr:hypothetical protein L2E82_28097 [Cichorium intybus]
MLKEENEQEEELFDQVGDCLGRTSEEKRKAICMDVKDVLVIVFNSRPSNFQEFFKWVAEVRQKEDSGQTLK